MERFLGQGRFELGPRAVRGVKGQTSSEGLPGNPGGTKVCVWGVGMFWKSAGTPQSPAGSASPGPWVRKSSPHAWAYLGCHRV